MLFLTHDADLAAWLAASRVCSLARAISRKIKNINSSSWEEKMPSSCPYPERERERKTAIKWEAAAAVFRGEGGGAAIIIPIKTEGKRRQKLYERSQHQPYKQEDIYSGRANSQSFLRIYGGVPLRCFFLHASLRDFILAFGKIKNGFEIALLLQSMCKNNIC